MSLEYAILGFLSYAPLTGYELKKAFDRSVRHFWPANQSQIYRTLAQLDEDGLVQKEVIERDERLDMKKYHITEAGRAALHRWLATPLPEQDSREPFLIQVFFGGQLADAELLRLLDSQLKVMEERLAVYEAVYQASQETPGKITDPRAVFLSLLTLEAGYVDTQSVAQWLRSAMGRIQSKDYAIHLTKDV
jgi:PadR family transcriptional regulator, regulatory protein AphA